MFHISVQFALTNYALHRSGVMHSKLLVLCKCILANFPLASPPDQWNDVQGHFLEHLDEINKDLQAAGLPVLGQGAV
jgi:homogentisate 1,2-dioxygenase